MRFYLPLDLRVPTLIKNQSSSSNNSFLRKTAPSTAVSDNNEPVHFSPIFKKNAFKLKRAEREILAAAEVKPMVSQSFVHGTVVENGQFVASLADLVIGAMMRVWFSETFWPQRTGYMGLKIEKKGRKIEEKWRKGERKVNIKSSKTEKISNIEKLILLKNNCKVEDCDSLD